jgi:hypothetical protein
VLVGLIAGPGLDVVGMQPDGTPPDGPFDAVMVNSDVELGPIEFDILVQLPSTLSGLGTARISNDEREEQVELISSGDLIDLVARLSSDRF